MPKPEKDLALGPPLKFYNNEITLQFSERDHIYYLVREDGSLEEQDGVTNSCNIIDHSLYLIPWAVKMTALKLLKTMPCSAEGNLEPIPWIQFENLVNEAKNARKEIFEDAGDVGTLAHKWLEDSIRWAITFGGGIVDEMNVLAPTDERAENCGKAGFAWMKSHNVRWVSTERKTYSRKNRFAGTLDGLAWVDSCDDPKCCTRPFIDELSLIDWKSSNRLRTEYLYQTAAYLNSLLEEFGEYIG